MRFYVVLEPIPRGWSNENPLAASASFFLFGEGNVPWMVRELVRKLEPNPERQPRVVIG